AGENHSFLLPHPGSRGADVHAHCHHPERPRGGQGHVGRNRSLHFHALSRGGVQQTHRRPRRGASYRRVSRFAGSGIDYVQWKTLTRTARKLDVRGAPSLQSRRRGSAGRSIFFQIALYSIMGTFIAVLLAPVQDLYLAALLLVAYVMFMVGTAALLDYNATIVSPE